MHSVLLILVSHFCNLFVQEKKALKEEKLKQEEKYMWAILDGVKEKVILIYLFLLDFLRKLILRIFFFTLTTFRH